MNFTFFTEGEKGSPGDKGSQGEKGQQGMPGTCDAKVIYFKQVPIPPYLLAC